MCIVQAINNHQELLLKSAVTCQAAAHSWPSYVLALFVTVLYEVIPAQCFYLLPIEVGGRKSECDVSILGFTFKPTSFIHDSEMGEWHAGQGMQMV